MSHPPQYPYAQAWQYQPQAPDYQAWQYQAQAPDYQYGASPAQFSWTQGWLAFNDPGYVKGLLLGAAAVYLLTNPRVQRAVVKSAVAMWTTVQGGVEEVKEQIQDIKAEMSMKTDADKK